MPLDKHYGQINSHKFPAAPRRLSKKPSESMNNTCKDTLHSAQLRSAKNNFFKTYASTSPSIRYPPMTQKKQSNDPEKAVANIEKQLGNTHNFKLVKIAVVK
jgi:hypothetical protein